MHRNLTIPTLLACAAMLLSGAAQAGVREDQLADYATAAKAQTPGFAGLSAERGNLRGDLLFRRRQLARLRGIARALALNPDGTPMFMITVEPGLFALAAGGASLVGILAALIPARRAARLDPVEAIRG